MGADNLSLAGKLRKALPNGDNLLLLLTALGVLVGIGLGIGLRQASLPPAAVHLVAFPGELLMRVLQLLILPLIITSLVSALASTDLQSRPYRLGLALVGYYIITTILASITGRAFRS